MAAMLGVPGQELWEQIPGVTQQDVDRWKASVRRATRLLASVRGQKSDSLRFPCRRPRLSLVGWQATTDADRHAPSRRTTRAPSRGAIIGDSAPSGRVRHRLVTNASASSCVRRIERPRRIAALISTTAARAGASLVSPRSEAPLPVCDEVSRHLRKVRARWRSFHPRHAGSIRTPQPEERRDPAPGYVRGPRGR